MTPRGESFGFGDRCENRPATSLTAPSEAPHGARIQWIPSPRDRWTPALVDYRAVVGDSNQAPLGKDRTVFATYMVAIHRRIHPFFSDRYIESLIDLPAGDSRREMKLTTLVEIVIARDGSISQIGVVCSSGNADFDIGVLDSVSRAAPFAPPPEATLSNDDRLYLRWWFGRNPVIGCAPMFARPYRLAIEATRDAGAMSPR